MGSTAKTNWDADFDVFWHAFPRKVGKLAAKKEYDKVRRGGIGQDELLDGVAQYVRSKPSYADWCHPRTWLSQGRWMDEAPKASTNGNGCDHEPRCPDGWAHGRLLQAEALNDPDLVAEVQRSIQKRARA